MRTVWSGMIQFGMVALPVRLFGATAEHDVRLHEIHVADGSRIEHRRFCPAEGREISYEEVGRGFALPDGRMVPLTEEDLARLPLPTKHTCEVLGFVPGADVDPISYAKPYYAGPGNPGADRPYALLVSLMLERVQASRCALRSRARRAPPAGDPVGSRRRCSHPEEGPSSRAFSGPEQRRPLPPSEPLTARLAEPPPSP
ncbi:Ku protein [Streptomyces sp. NPDC057557]|uniref:Ku protein n=1 Tax=Streptomyces sp. NPDC057557 TaxID=3346167 RepID=UPI0036CD92E2